MQCACCGVVLRRLSQFRFKECRLRLIRYQRLAENELTLNQISRLNVRNVSYNLKSISELAIIQMVKRQLHYAFSTQFWMGARRTGGENWQCGSEIGSVFTGTVGSVSFVAFESFQSSLLSAFLSKYRSNLETHRLLGKRVLRNCRKTFHHPEEDSGQYRAIEAKETQNLSSRNYCYRFGPLRFFDGGFKFSNRLMSHVRAERYLRWHFFSVVVVVWRRWEDKIKLQRGETEICKIV